MTYKVFGGMLSLAQSIIRAVTSGHVTKMAVTPFDTP